MGETVSNRQKTDWGYIAGILILCVGMQVANYGTAVCVSGEVAAMGAMQYYNLIGAMGNMGVMLILPVVGRLTGILGQRNMILYGIIIQALGRVGMMFSDQWVMYAGAYLLQSIGGGFYVSAAFVLMAGVVPSADRAKFFGYIAVANAAGAIFGPILVSAVYASGGLTSKLAYVSNLPFTLPGFVLLAGKCPNQKTPGAGKGFDFAGLALTVVGLACMVLWLNLAGKMFHWVSVPSIAMALAMVVCLGVLIRRELTIDNPAVPIRMFRNKRLTYAFIGGMISTIYATCSASYCVMWIRSNFQGLPASTLFNGTATMAQQIVIFVLGLFLGSYISKRFVKRFRPFGILANVAAVIATAILYCLKFTGTAANGDIVFLTDGLPLGMVLIYVATAIGGFTSAVAQSTYSAFWQSNTPREDIPSGQALYTLGSTGSSVVFMAVVGVVMGTSTDFSKAFATGLVFSIIGLICAIIGFRFSKEETAKVE